jgi:hypothetical protein
MIFVDKIACVVTIEHGQKWLTLHFHRACYVAWERMERDPPPGAEKVVALSTLPFAHRDEAQPQEGELSGGRDWRNDL